MNQLYPVFLKLHELKVLIVGAGAVGFEKLSFMLGCSPQAQVTVLAPHIHPQITALLHGLQNHRVTLVQEAFDPSYLQGFNMVIAATSNRALNFHIRQAAKKYNILVNVADTPGLCDFYLGAIVNKGNLKIAISTNGQSPTFAKRLKELLQETLPDETDFLLQNLHHLRNRLKGNFAQKVKKLNELTQILNTENG